MISMFFVAIACLWHFSFPVSDSSWLPVSMGPDTLKPFSSLPPRAWLSSVSNGLCLCHIFRRAAGLFSSWCKKKKKWSHGGFAVVSFRLSVLPAPWPPAIPDSHTVTGSRPVSAWPESHEQKRTEDGSTHSQTAQTHTTFSLWSFTPRRKEVIHSCRGFRGVRVWLFVCVRLYSSVLVTEHK